MNSPVVEIDGQPGAALADARGRPLPGHYTSVAEEHRALTRDVALLDRSYVGRLSFTGEDALDLLNRLSTNELMTLEEGRGTATVLTSNKGRIMDVLVVLRLSDRLMVLTAPQSRQKVAEWIDFYTIVEDIGLQDVTGETAMISVAGPEAAQLLNALDRVDVASMGRYDSAQASIGGVDASLFRTDFVGPRAYDLLVPANDGPRLWDELSSRGERYGLRRVGLEALEAVRVEQGVPAYGRELTEAFNPLEAGLRELISFTKGCYVGQEVVARLDTYKKVQKALVGLRWDGDTTPPPGARLLLDGKQVGVVTSASRSTLHDTGLGLAYVRRAQAEPGTVLSLETGEGPAEAEVVAPPSR